MIQFITGHNFLNRHNFIVHGLHEEVDPMCELCDYNYSQTTAHIIGECPALTGARLEVFSLYTIEPPFNFTIRAIVKFLHRAGIAALSMEEPEGVNQTS